MKGLQLLASLAFVFTLNTARAQFTPAFVQNDSYWADGKAEYNIYAAEIVREGAPRQCEVVHIFAREPGATPVLKLNQILNVPVGLLTFQQMLSSAWRVDNAQLAKFSLTSSDSIGNAYKEARRDGDHFTVEYRNNSDSGQENVAIPANAFFYDELPLLVRTVDFSKPSAPFEIQLAGSVINSKTDNIAFQPAKVSFVPNERSIDVKVQHAGGDDHFILDRQFPNLLREWKAADGSHLKMKRNLKVDYWNYTKPGDRERALNNPMLRLPD